MQQQINKRDKRLGKKSQFNKKEFLLEAVSILLIILKLVSAVVDFLKRLY